VKRRITAFDTDEHGDWRAAVECGHFQHVRHDPPLTTRSWLLTEEGRASRIGFELDCKRCWPGNVRQLRHVVEKLVVGTFGDSVIDADAVRRALDNHPRVGLCSADGRQPIAAYTESDSLDDFLDRAMLNLYESVRMKTGSHSQTARQLRIDRVSLYQRLERARRRLYLSTVNEAMASIV
jgi:hypothetical protein